MSVYVILSYKDYCESKGIIGTWEGLYKFKRLWRN